MSNGSNGGGFGLFVVFAVAAGIVMVLNPIEEDHLASLERDLGQLGDEQVETLGQAHLERLHEMVTYESYYLWSVMRLTGDASEALELEDELVMSVGAIGSVWSPADLQLFGARFDANMKVVHEGAAKAIEAVNPETINAAEKAVEQTVNAAMEGAADVVAEGAASAAALTEAANDAVKKTIKGKQLRETAPKSKE